MNAPQPVDGESNKNAKIMFAIFAVLTLIFACGGAAVTGLLGMDSERKGMDAAFLATGPACCAISGLLASGIGIVALKGKDLPQIIAPIVAGVLGGVFGAVSLMIFFSAIWPML